MFDVVEITDDVYILIISRPTLSVSKSVKHNILRSGDINVFICFQKDYKKDKATIYDIRATYFIHCSPFAFEAIADAYEDWAHLLEVFEPGRPILFAKGCLLLGCDDDNYWLTVEKPGPLENETLSLSHSHNFARSVDVHHFPLSFGLLTLIVEQSSYVNSVVQTIRNHILDNAKEKSPRSLCSLSVQKIRGCFSKNIYDYLPSVNMLQIPTTMKNLILGD